MSTLNLIFILLCRCHVRIQPDGKMLRYFFQPLLQNKTSICLHISSVFHSFKKLLKNHWVSVYLQLTRLCYLYSACSMQPISFTHTHTHTHTQYTHAHSTHTHTVYTHTHADSMPVSKTDHLNDESTSIVFAGSFWWVKCVLHPFRKYLSLRDLSWNMRR